MNGMKNKPINFVVEHYRRTNDEVNTLDLDVCIVWGNAPVIITERFHNDVTP